MGTRWGKTLVAAGAAGLLAAAGTTATVAHAQEGCAVSYTVTNDWPGGFVADVTVTNLGAPVTSWALTWTFGAGQQVTTGWNAEFATDGDQVEARNAHWNSDLGTGGSASFGFLGSWDDASNPAPDDFAFNGTPCTGETEPPPTEPPPTDPPALPDSFSWESGPELIGPRPEIRSDILSIKDPTVVHHNGEYHVYATAANAAGGWNLMYTSFSDWADAPTADHTYLDTDSAIGPGYRAAPQLVYFEPHDLWYLIYQTGLPSYSTNTDPGDPTGWSAPQDFIDSMPPVVEDNWNDTHWVDYWLICDDVNCYMFSHDGAGNFYRDQTTVEEFPDGFGDTIIVMQEDWDNRFHLWEASNIYDVQGSDEYLLIIEAIGPQGERYFRSWTATDLGTTQWTPLADTVDNPFAGAANVSFAPGVPEWTLDISHGELVRAGNDQTLPMNPCDMEYLYQGRDPASGGDYQELPYRLGLLTQTDSSC